MKGYILTYMLFASPVIRKIVLSVHAFVLRL